MYAPSLLADDAHRTQLAQLLAGLERRKALPGGAAREKLDGSLLTMLSGLHRPLELDYEPTGGPPPRPIGIAMALTLFAQPHMVATFARPPSMRDDRPVLQPVLIPMEVLSDLLGLAKWELEELQAEIDRRVGLHLKQHRAVSWLWAHFGLPKTGVSALVHVLFPGLQDVGQGRLGLSRRGGQLYALVDQPRGPRPDSVYLGWLDQKLEGAFAPRGTFAARYVDRSLRQTLCRCIGTDDDELVVLLERMVTVVPRAGAPEFLALDRWRSGAYDAVAGLAGPYPRSSRLTQPLAPDDVSFEGWIRREGDGLRVDNPKALFDSVALDRVTEVARQLQAHTLGSIVSLAEGRTMEPQEFELLRYDVRRHVSAALQPVLDWAKDPAATERVARRLGVTPERARETMDHLYTAWEQHMGRSWTGALQSGQPDSVASRLCAQLVRTRHSLRDLWLATPIFEQEHREAALLFAAFYFSEAPLDRLWGRDKETLGEDPVGAFFWRTWRNVLENQEPDSMQMTYQF